MRHAARLDDRLAGSELEDLLGESEAEAAADDAGDPVLVGVRVDRSAERPWGELVLDEGLRLGRVEDAGGEDRLLPWPSTAARFREDWLPNADWVELEGVGHCPQLDVPLETAQLIVGVTAR